MERTVVVKIEEGLHARPAALFVQTAGAQPVPVTIRKAADDASAAAAADSILSVMALGAGAGTEVVLGTPGDGPDDTAALDALETFLSQTVIA